MSDAHAEEAASPSPESGESKLPLILVGLNMLVALGAVGTLVYTRFMFKRPAITEEGERKRIEKAPTKDREETESSIVLFSPVTANIAQDSHGVNHYVTVAFGLDIRDRDRKGDLESIKPLLLDRFLTVIGKKSVEQLDNVQGRYVLRNELIEEFNRIFFENAGKVAAPSPTPAKIDGHAHEGGEGEGGGGEGKSLMKGFAAKHENKEPIKDLITSVYFSQFTVQ